MTRPLPPVKIERSAPYHYSNNDPSKMKFKNSNHRISQKSNWLFKKAICGDKSTSNLLCSKLSHAFFSPITGGFAVWLFENPQLNFQKHIFPFHYHWLLSGAPLAQKNCMKTFGWRCLKTKTDKLSSRVIKRKNLKKKWRRYLGPDSKNSDRGTRSSLGNASFV